MNGRKVLPILYAKFKPPAKTGGVGCRNSDVFVHVKNFHDVPIDLGLLHQRIDQRQLRIACAHHDARGSTRGDSRADESSGFKGASIPGFFSGGVNEDTRFPVLERSVFWHRWHQAWFGELEN